jgi:hypothetical protein
MRTGLARTDRRHPLHAAILALSLGTRAAMAADEIQVYNAEINRPGQVTLQMHGNWIARGRTTAGFPGGLVPEGSINGTPEFALGLTDSWEVGLYLPYAVTRSGDFEPGGIKLRTLVASPFAHDRRFFYGVNVEISDQPLLFEGNHWNSEIRPILGWRRSRFELILNPIVDVPLSGARRAFDFAPAARLAFLVSNVWAAGLEHYADLGPIDRFSRSSQRLQELFAVADYSGQALDLDFGIGRGLTPGSDDWTVKAILGWNLRRPPRPR